MSSSMERVASKDPSLQLLTQVLNLQTQLITLLPEIPTARWRWI